MAMEEEREHLHRENVKLRASIKERYRFGEIVGKSPGMQEVYELIMRAAGSNGHVIIQGDSGTGKELIARTIHDMSERKEAPFVPVNCGAVPRRSLRASFSGTRKGPYRGSGGQARLLDLARGGTLFLDEIGELTLNMQAKLLRAIDGGGYVAVGGHRIRQAEARIVAATNRDLGDMSAGACSGRISSTDSMSSPSRPPLRHRKETSPARGPSPETTRQ